MKKEEKNSNKCPICGRLTHKESKYCIFHAGAEGKTEDEFIEAIKEYIQKIKEEDKNYNFEKFIFIGDINFKKDLNITTFKNATFTGTTFKGYADFTGTTFKGYADFTGTTFKGNADFTGTTFEGYPNFRGTTFEGYAYFDGTTFKEYATFAGTTFKGNADFRGTTFKGYATFTGTTFKGYADFRGITFKGYATFTGTTFKGYAAFTGTTFEGYANFRGTTFEGYAYFDGTTFGGYANFEGITFKGNAYFEEATFEGDADFLVKSFVKAVTFAKVSVLPGKKLNLKVKNNKGNVSLERAYLENIYLELHLGTDVLIDFTDTLLRNTEIERDQIENHILQEENKEFFKAKKIYLLLKNNFHSIGRYSDTSWAYKKEKDMERKSYFHFKSLHKWLWSCLLNGLFGYGEQPVKVIASAIIIILIFTFLFMSSGISDTSIGGFTSKNFLDCVYFSIITFTTLGYGDFRPVEGCGRIFAGTEAFIGALMMALFVYTFARRTGGR